MAPGLVLRLDQWEWSGRWRGLRGPLRRGDEPRHRRNRFGPSGGRPLRGSSHQRRRRDSDNRRLAEHILRPPSGERGMSWGGGKARRLPLLRVKPTPPGSGSRTFAGSSTQFGPLANASERRIYDAAWGRFQAWVSTSARFPARACPTPLVPTGLWPTSGWRVRRADRGGATGAGGSALIGHAPAVGKLDPGQALGSVSIVATKVMPQ